MFKLEAPDNLSFAGLDLNKNLKLLLQGYLIFQLEFIVWS